MHIVQMRITIEYVCQTLHWSISLSPAQNEIIMGSHSGQSKAVFDWPTLHYGGHVKHSENICYGIVCLYLKLHRM